MPVARRLRSEDVLAALAELFVTRGPPAQIRSDNGPEFIANAVQQLLAKRRDLVARLDPGFSHGVTTTVAGNCGVGFAPVHDEHRQELMDFMTGVEDIPGIVLDEGLDWSWQSFPDYLDRISERRYAMDVGTHIPHGTVRVHVMGGRALQHEQATADDLTAMAEIITQGMAAGAAGFSTGRIVEHRSAKPRMFMAYPGGFNTYCHRCEEIVRDGYSGFRFCAGDALASEMPDGLSV